MTYSPARYFFAGMFYGAIAVLLLWAMLSGVL